MKKRNSQIKYYMDGLIVESLITDKPIKKSAQGALLSSLIGYVKDFVDQNIDPNNKTTSVISMLAPAALYKILDGMGFKWLKWILSIGAAVFKVDIKNALDKVSSSIIGDIKDNKEISMDSIESRVTSAVKDSTQAMTGSDPSSLATESFTLLDARMMKLAFIQYRNETSLIKVAGPAGAAGAAGAAAAAAAALVPKQGKFIGSVIKIITWLIKTILTTAGLLTAGSVVSKLVGKPNELDKSLKRHISTTPATSTSTQKKFPLNPNYDKDIYNTSTSSWTIKGIYVTDSTIKDLLVEFAKETYNGLENLDFIIRRSPKFNIIAENILNYNQGNLGSNVLLIPSMYHSKKEIVDQFIDDVAKEA
jgi:hypothetical protein